MKIEVCGNYIEIQDTGAPRGERNMWEVKLNDVTVYCDYNGRKARDLVLAIEQGLRNKKGVL